MHQISRIPPSKKKINAKNWPKRYVKNVFYALSFVLCGRFGDPYGRLVACIAWWFKHFLSNLSTLMRLQHLLSWLCHFLILLKLLKNRQATQAGRP